MRASNRSHWQHNDNVGIHLKNAATLSNQWGPLHLSGVNSKGRTQRFNLPVMAVGGFSIENSSVTVAADGEAMEIFKTSGSTASRVSRHRGKARGVLGYDILKHFVVTIDYKTGHVHLEPGSRSD